MIGQTVALLGALTILLAAVGVLRFDDTLSRLHALTKASTLGVLLVFAGAAIVLPVANDWTSLLLAMSFQVITSPISANLISRSVYQELVATGDRREDGEGADAEAEGPTGR